MPWAEFPRGASVVIAILCAARIWHEVVASDVGMACGGGQRDFAASVSIVSSVRRQGRRDLFRGQDCESWRIGHLHLGIYVVAASERLCVSTVLVPGDRGQRDFAVGLWWLRLGCRRRLAGEITGGSAF